MGPYTWVRGVRKCVSTLGAKGDVLPICERVGPGGSESVHGSSHAILVPEGAGRGWKGLVSVTGCRPPLLGCHSNGGRSSFRLHSSLQGMVPKQARRRKPSVRQAWQIGR